MCTCNIHIFMHICACKMSTVTTTVYNLMMMIAFIITLGEIM